MSSDQASAVHERKLGVEFLLLQSLALKRRDRVLILHQKEFHDACTCIRQTATELGIKTITLSFSRDDFVGTYPPAFAPERLMNYKTRAVILLMEWSEETTGGRLTLCRELGQAGAQWKVASMPGVNFDSLASCRGDLSDLERRCEEVFAVLSRTRRLSLQTNAPDGSVDRFTMRLQSSNSVFVSTGRIQSNSWGNVPSGEAFIVPPQNHGSGWVTFRGSLPGLNFAVGEWVRARVQRGRILFRTISGSNTAVRHHFTNLFFGGSGRPKAIHTNTLAEIGVGCNPGIRSLTGSPIFDEKKLGTVHLGFGSNDQFGGSQRSPVHHDLVCTECTLTATTMSWSLSLICQGNHVLSRQLAMPDLLSFKRAIRPLYVCRGIAPFEFAPADVGSSAPHTLFLKHLDLRGRPIRYPIASKRTAQIAKTILEAVRTRERVRVEKLFESMRHLEQELVMSVVAGLEEYRLILLGDK